MRHSLDRSLPSSILKWIVDENGVVSFGTCRQERDGNANQFFDPSHVFYRLRRQFGPGPSLARRALPAFDRLVERLDPRLLRLGGRQIVDLSAVQAVAGCDLDLLKPVQDVKFGQSDPVDAA